MMSADHYSLPNRETKPAILRWTEELLMAFLETFLHPLYMDESQPFGAISYAFSGPKPDPFIDLPPARPLDSHDTASIPHISHASKDRDPGEATAKSAGMSEGGRTPVRPEAGDHLRIYCDASHALALRTWLHNVRIPLALPRQSKNDGTNRARFTALGKHAVGIDGQAAGSFDATEQVRVFYKIRLTLVGARGEVLIVA